MGPAVVGGAIVAVFALGVAFMLGRWSADAPPSAPARLEAPVAQPPPAAWPSPPSAVQAPAAAPSAPPAPAPAVPAPAPSGTEVRERARLEATERIEDLRPLIVRTCWPAGGTEKGRTSSKVTFNLTFDGSGREIARGIVEDRRAPAGSFGRCLRELRGAELSITPTGSNVSVSIQATFP